MKKLMLLFLVLLSICSTALAESVDDVLKDCKLDRSRCKIVEWFKADKFVRFYDSTSVTVTGPGQFDVVIYDYFYDNTCRQSNCVQRGSKHYHKEKWGFDSVNSTGTLRAFALEDSKDTLDAYDYPTSMQIAMELKRNSIEGKTMLKIKDTLKSDKTFASEAPKQNKPKPEDNYGKFAPLPQPIGSSTDGEWTYLGRFTGPANLTYLENILKMTPFNGTTAQDGVLDVYYHHTHDRCHYYDTACGFGCILKFVPLDVNGNRLQRRGFYTELVDISGGTKGAFMGSIKSVRRYDTETHQLVETYERDGYKDSLLNPMTKYGYKGADFVGSDNPFFRAFYNSKCPGDESWKRR